MVKISGIPPNEPYDKGKEIYPRGDLRDCSSKLLERFLISKNTPKSNRELDEIEKISKNLSLLLWIGKSEILTPSEENKITEKIRDITDNFRQDSLYFQTCDIIQSIKNLSPKTTILEHFTEIEYEACLCKDTGRPCLDPELLQEEFEKILEMIKGKNDMFSIMKLEREIHEVKNIFLKDPSQIDLLLYNLDRLTHL